MPPLAMKRKKTVFFLAMVPLASLLLVLSAVSSKGFPARGEGTSCGIIAPVSGPLLVTEEEPKVVPFSFAVRGSVPEVRFLISRKDKETGITLLEETVKVRGGAASSNLSFKIPDGMPVGRHELLIEALDAGRGARICTGKIPYIVLPARGECLCRETRRGNGFLSEGMVHKVKNTGRYKNA